MIFLSLLPDRQHHVIFVDNAFEAAILLTGSKKSARLQMIIDYIPRHVSGAGDDLVVVKEAAAGQISVVSRQLAANTHVAFACL